MYTFNMRVWSALLESSLKAPLSLDWVFSLLNEPVWIVLIWHCCASECLCKQLCSYMLISNKRTSLQSVISIFTAVLAWLLWSWSVHGFFIQKSEHLRTRYNLVCESHLKTGTGGDKLPPHEKSQTTILFFPKYFFT